MVNSLHSTSVILYIHSSHVRSSFVMIICKFHISVLMWFLFLISGVQTKHHYKLRNKFHSSKAKFPPNSKIFKSK